MPYQRDLTEISPYIRIGQKLILGGFGALLVGGAIAKFFFTDQLGKGVPPMLWWILIPIWSTIGIGGILCIAGWARFPAAAPILDLPYERDKNGRAVSPIIKASMAFLSFIMLASSGLLAFAHTDWYQSLALYWMFCCSGFGLFLTTIYTEKHFPVTTTYCNALMFLFAPVWIPITWPLVVALELKEAAGVKPRRSFTEDEDPNKTVWQNILNSCQNSLGQAPRQFERKERLTYLHIPEPEWLRTEPVDEMATLFDALDELFQNGVVVWAHLIQANRLMFQDGEDSCPGEVVFSFDENVKPQQLAAVARGLFQLKGTEPDDIGLKPIASYLTNERVRVFGLRVPDMISDSPCFISSTFFPRHQLPNQKLCGSFFPVIASPDSPHVVIPLPERYWPEELIEEWDQ